MPRRRTLTPEFFSDEDLASLPYEARLLYAGLWCYADREGRLEDRPKYLKVMLFPYDRVDVDKLLTILATPQLPDRPAKRFISRYQVDGRQYIEIVEFLKHQSPHPHESASQFPDPSLHVITSNDLPLHVTANNDMATLPVTSNQEPVKGPRTKNQRGKAQAKNSIPPDFSISEAVKAWATKKGHTNLDAHLEYFKGQAIAKGYAYVDWDQAFENAIRDNWAKVVATPPEEPGEFDHLPRIDRPCWICGCYADGSETCRQPYHGLTAEQYQAGAWKEPAHASQ